VFNPYQHTIPLFRYGARFPHLEGTGVFIAVDKHRFVFTAAHVVEPSSHNFAFGYPNPATRQVEMFGHSHIPMISAAAQAGAGTKRAIYKDALDLAVLVLQPEFSQWLESRYIPYDLRKNRPRSAAAVVSICGWPESKNRVNETKSRFDDDFGCRHIQTQAVLKAETRLIGGDPEIHFAVRMDKRRDFIYQESGAPVPQLFSLSGMSGCGVWDLDMGASERFPACATALAGILVEDCSSKNLAKVIRARHLWSPLAQNLNLHPGSNP